MKNQIQPVDVSQADYLFFQINGNKRERTCVDSDTSPFPFIGITRTFSTAQLFDSFFFPNKIQRKNDAVTEWLKEFTSSVRSSRLS